jgi:hypothetical protein
MNTPRRPHPYRHTQLFPLAWVLFFVKPKIAVDGQEMQAPAWGRTHLPARPGQHHVHVRVPAHPVHRRAGCDLSDAVPALRAACRSPILG